MVLTREHEIQLLATTFIRSTKKHGQCTDAKSVYFLMGQYDISKKRIYAVRQHVIQSVSTHLNSSTTKLINGANREKNTTSEFSQQQQLNDKLPRELRQLQILAQELPLKRNGRI